MWSLNLFLLQNNILVENGMIEQDEKVFIEIHGHFHVLTRDYLLLLYYFWYPRNH